MSRFSNERAPGKEHIPLYPKGFIAVRIIQLVITILCLALCAFGIALLPIVGADLMLFTAIASLIASIYCLVAHYGPPRAFNYWAILGLDIFLVLFWLISFCLLAVDIAGVLAIYGYCSDYYYACSDESVDTAVTVYSACLAAAAGLGGVQFIIYVVSLSIHGVMLHRHRKAGLKSMPGLSTSTSAPNVAAVPDGEKIQMQPQIPQHYSTPGSPPPPGQQMYAPPQPQQMYASPQQQQQQQSFYPQQDASPISTQPTGNSSYYSQPMNQGHAVYEAPNQPIDVNKRHELGSQQ